MAGMHRLCRNYSHTKHSLPFAIVFSTPIHKISFIHFRLNQVIVEIFCSLNLAKCGWLQGNVRGRRSPIPPISALSTVQGVAGDLSIAVLAMWATWIRYILFGFAFTHYLRSDLLAVGRSRPQTYFLNFWRIHHIHKFVKRFAALSIPISRSNPITSISIRNVRHCLHLRQYSILLNKLSSIFNLNFEWMYTHTLTHTHTRSATELIKEWINSRYAIIETTNLTIMNSQYERVEWLQYAVGRCG